MNDSAVVRAMSTTVAHYVCVDVFTKALKELTIAKQEPQLLELARMLSACPPFPWSRPVFQAAKTAFNMVPCDNKFELQFAKFLEGADDVRSFAKLPQPFGFSIEYTDSGMNLRSYYPDFIAVTASGVNWLLETKGVETEDVSFKDAAAQTWCDNATLLTGSTWKYAKVPQKAFEVLQPAKLADLAALQPLRLVEP